jgi:predicted transcriptional regulator YdeE
MSYYFRYTLRKSRLGELFMNYEIVNLEEKQVVGLVKETTNNNNKAVKDIKTLWEEFLIKGHYLKELFKVRKIVSTLLT